MIGVTRGYFKKRYNNVDTIEFSKSREVRQGIRKFLLIKVSLYIIYLKLGEVM